jgi:CheY-like chemotaxis protein
MALPDRIYQRLLALDDDETEALTNEFLKTGRLDELFDTGLLPALRLAEQDRHAGLLSDSQQAFVVEAIRELAEEAGSASSDGPSARPANEPPPDRETAPGRVLCLAVRDEADEVAAVMLSRLLGQRGWEVEMGSAVIQAGELLDRARAQRLTAIVLSIVPPLGGRDGRYLCRRVRGECPDLPIIAGLWRDGMDTTRQRLLAAGATRVVTTLGEAVESVQALANKIQRIPQPNQIAADIRDWHNMCSPSSTLTR